MISHSSRNFYRVKFSCPWGSLVLRYISRNRPHDTLRNLEANQLPSHFASGHWSFRNLKEKWEARAGEVEGRAVAVREAK